MPALLVAACSADPPQPPPTPDPVKALARSLGIVRSATEAQPRVLRILFYGQSISTPKWTDQAVATLRARHPNVAFDVRNLAIGGFAADRLQTTTSRDIASFQPDLIVFHVFGDHRAYERIIRKFRAETAADIIVATDHVTQPVEPLCPTGLHLRWSPPAGCTGHVLFKQHVWEDFMSGIWIPTMAQKYDLAVEPRRVRWNAYLQAHHLRPAQLLADRVHPNDTGWRLMAALFTSWFETLVAHAPANGAAAGAITSLPPPAPGRPLRFAFEGSRVELVAAGPLAAAVSVTIDGKPPEAIDGCWLDSRVSRLPAMPDWPAIARIWVDPGYHKADRWTVRVSHLNPAQDDFDFSLASAAGGPDGQGRATAPFVSRSGRVKIEPADWVLDYARRTSGKPVAEGTTFGWQRDFVCTDEPAVLLPNGAVEQRHVLATGLANRRHIAELTVRPGAPHIAEIRVYRPALQP